MHFSKVNKLTNLLSGTSVSSLKVVQFYLDCGANLGLGTNFVHKMRLIEIGIHFAVGFFRMMSFYYYNPV